MPSSGREEWAARPIAWHRQRTTALVRDDDVQIGRLRDDRQVGRAGKHLGCGNRPAGDTGVGPAGRVAKGRPTPLPQ